MILALSYGLVYGVYCAIGASMSNLLNPFGYSPTQISIAGASCLVSGVVGALLIGCYLDYSGKYRRTHIGLTVMVVLSCGLLYLILKVAPGNLGALIFSTILVGVACVSFFPASLSYGAELTFPL